MRQPAYPTAWWSVVVVPSAPGGQNSQFATAISAPSITDGLSNTMLVGEKRMNAQQCTTVCSPDDNDGYVGGFQDDVVRWGCYPPQQDWYGDVVQPGNIEPGDYQFGSSHPVAFQSVFCDGSLHVIHYAVNDAVFNCAASRNDGVPFNSNDL